MKLTISNTLVASTLATVADVAVYGKTLYQNHTGYSASLLEIATRRSSYNGKTVEETLKEVKEQEGIKSLDLSFKLKSNKFLTVTPVKDQVEIEVNDEAIKDVISFYASICKRFTPALIDLLYIGQSIDKDLKVLEGKWSETIIDPVTITGTPDNVYVNYGNAVDNVPTTVYRTLFGKQFKLYPIYLVGDDRKAILAQDIFSMLCTNHAKHIEKNDIKPELVQYINLVRSAFGLSSI